MATGRKLVSDVRGMLKMLSTDSLITDRVILSELKNVRSLLVKRETNLRKLWATDTLFTTIPCLEMVEVPISECCDYQDPCTVARTKLKLPKIAEGNYQYVIQGVYSINALGGRGKKLKEITVNRYVNLLKLPIIKKEEYYWITNDYLYVNNPMLKSIRLVAFFEEDVPNEIMYPDSGCKGCEVNEDEYCKNPLDKDFAIPGYLEEPLLQMTSERLMSTYFKVKTDMTENGIDAQAPNTKPTD
jgi:hypothetical protein